MAYSVENFALFFYIYAKNSQQMNIIYNQLKKGHCEVKIRKKWNKCNKPFCLQFQEYFVQSIVQDHYCDGKDIHGSKFPDFNSPNGPISTIK